MVEDVEWPRIGMTLEETAKALRVDSKTLRALIKTGDFPARKVGVGWRVEPNAVKSWLDSREPKSPISGPSPGWAKVITESSDSEND